ncbi:MAG: type VI secretion system protein TssA [Planctomycetes bacterium]|nr:type VI secretion system protein TssA [Planctomycetota bacterium]
MIDVASLLQPISADRPTGTDLRHAQLNDHPLDKVKKERFQEDPLTLPPGAEPRKVHWQGVADGCKTVLQRHSKDLEAAAYLTEALIRLDGLAGLAQGLEVVHGLIAGFWPGLHPGAPSADDPEPMPALRTKWLTWLGGANDLQNALRTVPVGAVGEDGRVLQFGDLLDARRVQQAYQANPAEYGRLVEAKLLTPEAWATAIGRAHPDRLAAVADLADQCRQRVRDLAALCEQQFPADAVPSLDRLAELLELLAQEMRAPAGAPATTDGAGTAGADAGAASATAGGAARGPSVAAPGSIGSREDAVRALQAVSRFLRQNEPHSPVSYMIERCARWLGMTFDQLMQDLTKDPAVMDSLREKLGIEPPAQS